jgi:hypothetical protein
VKARLRPVEASLHDRIDRRGSLRERPTEQLLRRREVAAAVVDQGVREQDREPRLGRIVPPFPTERQRVLEQTDCLVELRPQTVGARERVDDPG